MSLLIENLQAARQLYDRDVQLGSAGAQLAVAEFLAAAGASPELQVPFKNLAGALTDAINGISNPHLRIGERAGDIRSPFEERDDKSRAAAIVTMLIEAGHSQSWALGKVARATGGALTSAQIKNYRKSITRGKKADEYARENYQQHLGAFRQHIRRGVDAKVLANSALALLERTTRAAPRVS